MKFGAVHIGVLPLVVITVSCPTVAAQKLDPVRSGIAPGIPIERTL